MHNKPETLGHIIKAAREHAGITIEGQEAELRCFT